MKPLNEEHLAVFRRHMVETIDVEFDVLADEIGRDRLRPDIREAFLKVPRHLFVPAQIAAMAYQNRPLPIGFDKTTSQPLMCALMVELLDLGAEDAVLEIGTGFGYLTAILCELAGHVWSVEIVEEFAGVATQLLGSLGYRNATVRVGDGSRGWPEQAPFDAILISAAAAAPPAALVEQLKPGGRMVLPLGDAEAQRLVRIEKAPSGALDTREIMAVRFTELETVF